MTQAMIAARNLHDWEGELPRFPDADQKAAYFARNRIRYSLTEDDWAKKVHAFHVLMQSKLADEPSLLVPEDKNLWLMLLHSEVHEMETASNPIELLDGALDVCYVALGIALKAGFTPQQIVMGMEEVHASNLTKVMDDGKPLINDGLIRPDEPVGKVLKTNNYVRPDLAAAISVMPI